MNHDERDRRPAARRDVDRELAAFAVATTRADRQVGFGLRSARRPGNARSVGTAAMPSYQQKKRVERNDEHESDDEHEIRFGHWRFPWSSDDGCARR